VAKVNINYISESTQRTLKVQKLLAGHEAKGLTPGEIAKAVEITPSNVTRALHNLLHAGLAEEHPQIKGHWRLSVSWLTKVAMSILRAVDSVTAAVHDIKRYQTQL